MIMVCWCVGGCYMFRHLLKLYFTIFCTLKQFSEGKKKKDVVFHLVKYFKTVFKRLKKENDILFHF